MKIFKAYIESVLSTKLLEKLGIFLYLVNVNAFLYTCVREKSVFKEEYKLTVIITIEINSLR